MPSFRNPFSKLFGKAASGATTKPLDENTRAVLLSAAGTVGQNFYEVLSANAHSQEQRFILNLETDYFGTAVSSYFYVTRYAKHADPTDFALDLFDSYRVAWINLNPQIDTVEERDTIDQLLRRFGPPAIEEYTRSLLLSAVSPMRIFDPLRGRYKGEADSKSPSGLDLIVSVLVSRLRIQGGLDFTQDVQHDLCTKSEIDFQALIDSFERLLR